MHFAMRKVVLHALSRYHLSLEPQHHQTNGWLVLVKDPLQLSRTQWLLNTTSSTSTGHPMLPSVSLTSNSPVLQARILFCDSLQLCFSSKMVGQSRTLGCISFRKCAVWKAFQRNTDLCEAIPTKSPCAACCPMWLIAVYNLAWEKQQPVLS